MGLQTLVSSGTAKVTSTGTANYTGVGFTPKAIIFFVSAVTDDSVNTHDEYGIGLTDGSSKNFYMGFYCEDRFRLESTSRTDSSGCIFIDELSTGAAGILNRAVAALHSFTADGFILDWTTVESRPFKFSYMAIGGDSVSVDVDYFVESTSSGNYSVTKPGFNPDFSFLVWTDRTTWGTNNGGTHMGISGAVSSTERAFSYRNTAGSGASNNTQRSRLRTTKLIELTDTNSDTVNSDHDFVSMDATGFTIDRTTDDTNDRLVIYLAISGAQVSIDQFSTPTSSGDDAYTGIGFKPESEIVISHCSTANSTSVFSRQSFGAMTGTSNQGVLWGGNREVGSNVDDAGSSYFTDRVLACYVASDGTASFPEDEAAFSSFDNDGFTLNYTIADANERLFLSFSMRSGGSAVAPSLSGIDVNSFIFGGW